jgi:RNA-directed DNA polymerase
VREAYFTLKRRKAAGVDGQTREAYGRNLEENLKGLSGRLRRGAYRARRLRRTYISKRDGGQRPIGIPVLEDKRVQKAMVKVLSAVYEVDFRGFSYGFRPGRSQQRGLHAAVEDIESRKVNWVLDVDIRGFLKAKMRTIAGKVGKKVIYSLIQEVERRPIDEPTVTEEEIDLTKICF